MVEFIGACFADGCGAAALASHCSAIAYGHRIRGLPDSSADFRVRKLLAGARRLRPSCDSRSAITLGELERSCGALQLLSMSSVESAAFRAVFSLALFAMLRPGEVLVGGEPGHTICVRHIVMRHDRMVITLPSSKTSPSPFQHGAGRKDRHGHMPGSRDERVSGAAPSGHAGRLSVYNNSRTSHNH